MTLPPSAPASGTPAAARTEAAVREHALTSYDITKDNLFAQIKRMAGAFWASRERNQLLLLCAGLVIVVAATALMQIRLNAWNRPFYDALIHKDIRGFVRQLVVFAELAAVLLVLNVSQVWLN